ncbi:urea ABC transporter substrate-binding protein [Singulisphaera sp. PoT]|uniref:urea ABC transporter substrate-binding protein n=1 Tax=Singulisphaera sp. PoT TaxID=3411797 RepID=UPI003BF48BA2
MKRLGMWIIGGLLLIGAIGFLLKNFSGTGKPIVVGILHSQTGPMEISEKSMIDAEVMALEEINAQGGLLGRKVEWVIADGRSDWQYYAQQAERLIKEDHVAVIFGCWTSASRKMVMPVVEANNHLLMYPMAYEGLEQSPNIVYTGAAPNQQIIPTVKWSYDTLKARKFFLVGSDYVWPRAVNAIVKDQLKALGAELVGEEYIFFGSSDVDDVIAKIKAAKPDVILSAVVGETNLPFYDHLRRAGIRPEQTPVISFSMAEDELRKMSKKDMVGNYSAWNYFQSIERKENQEFVKRFQKRYGADRVTSDVITAAYNSVLLWAQAVREAETDDIKTVRRFILRQSLNAPEGVVSVDPETQHTWRPVYIARIGSDGQFEIVWTSEKPVRPIPYPISRSKSEWEQFLNDMHKEWGGWANPKKSVSPLPGSTPAPASTPPATSTPPAPTPAPAG